MQFDPIKNRGAMYENDITEPRWKSWIVQTTTNPLFTPEQCQMIIECW